MRPSDLDPRYIPADDRMIIINRILKEGYKLPLLPESIKHDNNNQINSKETKDSSLPSSIGASLTELATQPPLGQEGK
jgi:hypothetical protein